MARIEMQNDHESQPAVGRHGAEKAVQGVDAAYLKELQSAGFKVDIDDAIGAKVQGVTPEFIQKVRSHGFKDLSLEQVISQKRTGVLDPEK